MPEQQPDFRQLGFYYSLAQVSLEMVAPLGIGAYLDYRFGWTPWATVIGFVFGFVGGFLHLMVMLKQHEEARRRKPPGDPSP